MVRFASITKSRHLPPPPPPPPSQHHAAGQALNQSLSSAAGGVPGPIHPPGSASPVKKRAFVSTVRRGDDFGPPPPLPPRPSSTEKSRDEEINRRDNDNLVYNPADISEPDSLAANTIHLLQRQTVRWLNLSLSLWSMMVLDSYRTVSMQNLRQFIEVIAWRAHGQISEDEFSALFSEWTTATDAGSGTAAARVGTAASGGNKQQLRRVAVGVFGMRQVLLERNFGEAELDLSVGIIIHEVNMRLLNSSISFMSQKPSRSQSRVGVLNPYSLEVCTDRWLSLCEELFFLLDTPGYGVLKFDELFFYTACLTIGMQSWTNEAELEEDLSLGTLTAATLQMLQDCGANALVSLKQFGAECRSLVAADGRHSISSPGILRNQQQLPANGGKSSNVRNYGGKHEVSLSMMKRYLLRRNVGEMALCTMIDHVKSTIERIARLSRLNNAHILYDACKPLEELGSIGSPRLWQQAVLSASGFAKYKTQSHGDGNEEEINKFTGDGVNVPSILQFLLSDAERLLPGSVRAIELPIEGLNFVDVAVDNSKASDLDQKQKSAMNSAAIANNELHEAVQHIWNGFRRWGSDSSGMMADSIKFNTESRHQQGNAMRNRNVEMTDMQRDPIYQLILTCVLRYKALQHMVIAALFDVSVSYFGEHCDPQSEKSQSSGSLMVVCAGQVSSARQMMIELGFRDTDSSDVDEAACSNDEAAVSPIVANGSNPGTPFTATSALTANTYEEGTEMTQIKAVSNNHDGTGNGNNHSRNEGGDDIEKKTNEKASDLPQGSRRRTKNSSTASFASNTGVSNKSSMQDEMLRAQWMPLFDRSEEDNSPYIQQPPSSSHEKSSAVHITTKKKSHSPEKKSRKATLSTDEAHILSELLSSQDVSEQQELINRLKAIRLPENAAGQLLGSHRLSDHQMQRKKSGELLQTPAEQKKSTPPKSFKSGNSGGHRLDAVTSSDQNDDISPRALDKSLIPEAADSVRKKNLDQVVPNKDQLSSDIAAGGPKSIEELLNQGKGAGKYAKMLREILRKMSRDDSEVQVQSLEQVLQLGYSIAQLDEMYKEQQLLQQQHKDDHDLRRKSPPSAGRGRNRHSNGSVAIVSSPTTHRRQPPPPAPLPAHLMSNKDEENVTPSFTAPADRLLKAPPAITNGSDNTVINRLAAVPGHVPTGVKQNQKKAFGHPV